MTKLKLTIVVESVLRKETLWLERLARFGCLTKGLVYFILGFLSLRLAMGVSSTTTNSKGALKFISNQPLGKPALVVVAIGLVSYTLWRLLEAINPYSFELSRDKVVKRLSLLASGISYGSLAFSATKIVLNMKVTYQDTTTDWTATLMSQPFGQLLVMSVGLVVIGVGCTFFYRAFRKPISQQFHLVFPRNFRFTKILTNVSKFGIMARGFIFMLIGFFLVQSGRKFDPETAAGLDQILEMVATQPQGKIFLTAIALGLIAYSLHMLIEAKYRDFSSLQSKK